MSIISDGYSTYLVLGISPVSAANYVSYANKLSSFILGVWGSGGGGGEASWSAEGEGRIIIIDHLFSLKIPAESPFIGPS